MSKRVQRYECDTCREAYADRSGADECERRHVEEADGNEREKLWGDVVEESYRFTADQLRQILALMKSWGIEPSRRAHREER